jgi:branched-subunit amino acid transport protein
MVESSPPTLEIVLAMAVVTYLLRSAPLLAGWVERVPPGVFEYLRLVAPAILGALAAVNVAVLVHSAPTSAGVPSFQVGIEWVAVLLCAGLVALRGSLVLGLVTAVLFVAIARQIGGS